MFTEQERRIFGPYQDSTGVQMFADPVAVYRRLVAETAGNLDALLEQYNQGEVGMAATAERLAKAAVKAFDLQPFDKATGQGTLQDEALALLAAFLEWRDQKKTMPAISPTSAPVMGQDGCPAHMRRQGTYTTEAAPGMGQPRGQPQGQRPPSRLRPTTLSG